MPPDLLKPSHQITQDMEQVHSNPNTLVLTTRLFDAALKGDVNSLRHLVQEDPLILDRCIIENADRFMQSPLHIATNLGHLEFVTELLCLKPELAEQLEQSTRSSALHLASAKGHLDIVKKLLEVKPSMCLAPDRYGRNPVHVAAVSSQLDVLELLVRTRPHAAREKTNAGETVLHLCVKYDQIEALKYLVDAIDDSELLNAKDANDSTVLHLVVVAKQLEAVKYLVANKKVHRSSINKNGLRPIDWIVENSKTPIDKEIIRTLESAKKLKANWVVKQNKKDEKWLKKQSNALMVVASLIATMAFQIGVNPPGGAWQDNSDPNKIDGYRPHLVGTSIMANRDPDTFDSLTTANAISLLSSLSVVLLLLSGIPYRRLFVVILMVIMCVATTSTIVTYFYTLEYLTKEARGGYGTPTFRDDVADAKAKWLGCWIILVVILLFGYFVRLLFKPLKYLLQLLNKNMYKDHQLGSILP